MGFEHILVQRSGDFATVTMNRPQRRNALSLPHMRELIAAFGEIGDSDGLATAAGCQLVATADLAVASENASFATPGGKGGWFCHTPMVAVARNIGQKRAMEMAMSGDD